MVQVNWTDTNTWPMWEQANANYLAQGPLSIDIDRWSFRGTLRGGTCQLTVHDPDEAIRLGKASSPLSPNVQLGRRLRVLAQSSPGVWQPWFFGYLSDIRPDPTDPAPPRTTLTADSPLTVLAPQEITLPVSTGAVVYDADDPDHSALVLLMQQVGLWGTAFVDFDDVGAVALPDDWAGATRTFAEWLSALCTAAGCLMSDEPQYATSAGAVDWTLRWYRPGPTAAPTFHWSAPDGDLGLTPELIYNGEAP